MQWCQHEHTRYNTTVLLKCYYKSIFYEGVLVCLCATSLSCFIYEPSEQNVAEGNQKTCRNWNITEHWKQRLHTWKPRELSGVMRLNWNYFDPWISDMSVVRFFFFRMSCIMEAMLKKNVMPSVFKLKVGNHLDFPARQWSRANVQVQQTLLQETYLESPWMDSIGNIWWNLKKVRQHRNFITI